MKITDVRPFYPDYRPPRAAWRRDFWQFGVEIHTDDGLVGIGAGGGGVAGVAVVTCALRDVLLGRDPFEVEQLWEDMYWATAAYGRKGVAIMAISGVDIALWDLIGKARGEPVYRCLGGPTKQHVQAYATGVNVEANRALGFRAFKVSKAAVPEEGREGMRRNVERVARAREIAGEDAELMLDCWMGWDVDYTLEMADRLAPYRLKWIEEPLIADDYDGYARLTAEVKTTRIATGEHEFTRYGFKELIDRRAAHILQPDITWCGGITEAKKICAMAAAHRIPVIPHRGGEVWGLHLVMAEQCPMAELLMGSEGVPRDPGVTGVPEPQEGYLRPFDRPGFGVTWDEGIGPAQDSR